MSWRRWSASWADQAARRSDAIMGPSLGWLWVEDQFGSLRAVSLSMLNNLSSTNLASSALRSLDW